MSTNRLGAETSAYLRQHAGNPVDWMPWGDEAFARARAEDRPVFLSIGYAACHWCHVMERESFSDPAIAAVLNARFVCIKVDREERPDVDAIYIAALLELQGKAGWPATLFLLPDRRPFTGATYLPPVSRFGLPSLPDVCERIAAMWKSDRDTLLGAADMLRKALYEEPSESPEVAWDGYRRAVATLVTLHDDAHGGFGTGSKFPQVPELELLLLAAADELPGVADVLRNTLIAMDRGGLQDALGGGFHRYCVDRAWTVPHFEKMLYDNAQLVRLYARASSWLQRLGRDASDEVKGAIRVVRDAIGWMETSLRVSGGAFAASFDADDPGGEGAFYTWTPDEIRAVLGDVPMPYGVRPEGNFEGRTVLNTRSGVPPRSVRDALLRARAARPAPPRDDKQVVAWNGLAIGALAEAGRLFGQEAWVELAAAVAK
ncbi:MAG: thioredoxin domain-containing protein, partial [Deltaproteobacteria bacterium]|nr:thioredoxin domain-containing protein [Deltaproteobacteria bacterium]